MDLADGDLGLLAQMRHHAPLGAGKAEALLVEHRARLDAAAVEHVPQPFALGGAIVLRVAGLRVEDAEDGAFGVCEDRELAALAVGARF